MVWQDFWLANPWDGPEPFDNGLFLDDMRDLILRIRNHASIGLYCGRNEGNPPKPLEDGIRKTLGELHPGLHYIPNSAFNSAEDSTLSCITMEYPLGFTPVHFLRLTLTRGAETLSSNFYLRGLEENNHRAIRQLPKPKVNTNASLEHKDNLWRLTTELRNDAAWPALMIRVKAVREKSGDRILPALYSDNYISLMPGEHRTIVTEVKEADARGEKPAIVVGA